MLTRLALVPIVAALVLAGIWVAGGQLSDDFRLSMLLTALWLGLCVLVALLVLWRRRSLALPVLGTVVVTAGGAGGYLLYASSVDKVVDEDVAAAGVGQNVAVAAGTFVDGEHEAAGRAALVRLAGGRTVLTLTDFETSPGPDLRVYLATGTTNELGDVVDLGALRGNKGDQEYDVPAGVALETHRTVVIWCRAFSVAFGSAELA